ncbi:NUDIX hydrolase [Rhizohabitans arisaemae]|uniref:NUDIX hydrolase n=1 Tax=Rhizohabitans arisaemae TaxID=2720610 RepID=UPI0024B03C2F|nr:NUDIX domain-containing protein [Rhizohabitans arisaemae]
MTAPAIRASARVLLTDRRDRVLLLRHRPDGNDPARHVWFTPGGGVRAGEAVPEAAVREIREETGYPLTPERLGPVVATSSGPAVLDGQATHAINSFFFVRVDRLPLDVSGREPYEREFIVGHRWWTAEELESTEETILPDGLHHLMRMLLGGGLPAVPVVLPWRPRI